jgi:hypothetical protein
VNGFNNGTARAKAVNMHAHAALLLVPNMPDSPPPDASTFTTHDRERLVEVATTVGFVNSTLARLEAAMTTASTNTRGDIKELEGRIRTLENFRWWILGGAGLASIGGEVLMKYLLKP